MLGRPGRWGMLVGAGLTVTRRALPNSVRVRSYALSCSWGALNAAVGMWERAGAPPQARKRASHTPFRRPNQPSPLNPLQQAAPPHRAGRQRPLSEVCPRGGTGRTNSDSGLPGNSSAGRAPACPRGPARLCAPARAGVPARVGVPARGRTAGGRIPARGGAARRPACTGAGPGAGAGAGRRAHPGHSDA